MTDGIIEAGYLNQGKLRRRRAFYLPQGKLDAVLEI